MSNTTTSITFEIFDFYIPKVLILIISVLSAFGNSCIILATIRKKSLRSPCNILIAFAAIGDFSAQGVHYVNAYYSFNGIYPPLGTCWRIILLPYCLFGTSFVSTFFIGVDRLICIVFPALYYKFSVHKLYVVLVGLLALLYSFMWVPFSYQFVIENEELLQYNCGWGSFIYKSDTVNKISSYSKISLCIGMLVIYLTCWVFMKFKNVITIVTAFTWPLSMIIFSITGPSPNTQSMQLLRDYGGVLINMGIATNYFIFFAFSAQPETFQGPGGMSIYADQDLIVYHYYDADFKDLDTRQPGAPRLAINYLGWTDDHWPYIY